MRKVISALTICVTALALVPGEASADEDNGYGKSDWPLSLVKRPLVLATGMLEIRGDTVRMNLSKGAALEPISLAPDVFVGVAKGLAIGITHDTGICLTGAEGGCSKVYNDVGLEAQYSLMGRGSFQLAATGGASSSSLASPFVAGLNVGFITRLRLGKFAVEARPRLYVGVVERETRADTADIPVDLQYQLNTQTAVVVETGFAGSLDDLGGDNRIPVGLAALFAVNEKLDFGAAFRLTNVAGTDGGIDGREFAAHIRLRL